MGLVLWHWGLGTGGFHADSRKSASRVAVAKCLLSRKVSQTHHQGEHACDVVVASVHRSSLFLSRFKLLVINTAFLASGAGHIWAQRLISSSGDDMDLRWARMSACLVISRTLARTRSSRRTSARPGKSWIASKRTTTSCSGVFFCLVACFHSLTCLLACTYSFHTRTSHGAVVFARRA